ncbi:hypothetical protein I4U23_010728 [Adineta vaga]|nr:hypothetical protein I4U23_010728 [Adineta vaga]
MQQLKRQRGDSFGNFHEMNDRKKIIMKTKSVIRQFEDLPNELIYEIFDYLEYYHIYESFSNLNDRFRFLLMESTLLPKINISLISKTTFNRFYELITLLSYFPCLRSISTTYLWHEQNLILKSSCPILNHLTHAYLKLLSGVTFNNLEQFLINCCPSLQMLRISGDEEFLNANRWQQLISSFLVHLQTFDIQCKIRPQNDITHRKQIEEQMDLFNSSFWSERQWFFECRVYSQRNYYQTIFCSTNPFRRKTYRLCKQWDKIIHKNNFQTIFNSVDHVIVKSKAAINEYMYYFPYTTTLTLNRNIFVIEKEIEISLICVIPLKKIKTLIMDCNHLCPLVMCQLLSHMPNLHTLVFRGISFYKRNRIFIEQNELFRSTSKTNLIKNLNIDESCRLEDLEFILKLFPHFAIS